MRTALKYIGALSTCAALVLSIAFVADCAAGTVQDKYTVKVPGGLAFAEFKGFESWQAVSVSSTDKAIAVILGNPGMIAAFKAGIPGNGKPVPEGREDGQDPLEPEKERVLPDRIGIGYPAKRGLNG